MMNKTWKPSNPDCNTQSGVLKSSTYCKCNLEKRNKCILLSYQLFHSEFPVFVCMLRVPYWYKWIYLFLNISQLWEIMRVTFKCTNLYHLQNPLELTHNPAFQHARSVSLHYFLFLLEAALFKGFLRTQLKPQAESILRCC